VPGARCYEIDTDERRCGGYLFRPQCQKNWGQITLTTRKGKGKAEDQRLVSGRHALVVADETLPARQRKEGVGKGRGVLGTTTKNEKMEGREEGGGRGFRRS